MGMWSVVRWARAAGFAAVCAALAAAGHVLGGGTVPRWALLAGFAVMFAVALALSGRERTTATILPAVAFCQVVLHILLSQAAEAAPPPDAVAQTAAMQGSHGGSPTLGMLLMHAVAILVTSWWLECGESRLCGLVRRLTYWALRAFFRLRPVPVYGPTRVVPRRIRTLAALHAVVLRYAMVRRGPPKGLAALAG